MGASITADPRLELEERKDGLSLKLKGEWRLSAGLVSSASFVERLKGISGTGKLDLDASGIEDWDSSLVCFLVDLRRGCEKADIEVAVSGIPTGAGRLVDMALAVPEREGAKRTEELPSFLVKLGEDTMEAIKSNGELVEFLGESTLALGRALRGKARYQLNDVFLVMHQCGPDALPIISLISLLVGVILGFVGLVQLEQFGADIFVANLVAVSMVREMGGMMTGIVMAGRTGAAFAAQLGTMQVNDEVSAFETLGIPPVDFLVLPRMLALIVAIPILTIYANIVGMVGGALVAVSASEITLLQYYSQTTEAVNLVDWAGGLFKASVYGVIVAVAGCLRGMQCSKSASGVGQAATSAVVTSIVLIIAAQAIFTVMFTILGI